ncbi:MAG: PIN/TRAM domain-containing protein [Akkermansiaceae bacterium]|jgi:uncharacterized protein YacL
MSHIGMNQRSVNIARLVYLLVCQAGGVLVALTTEGTGFDVSITHGFLAGSAVGLVFIGIDKLMEGFTLRGFSTATFGLGVGLFCAWLLTRVEISALLELALHETIEASDDGESLVNSIRLAIDVTLFASLGFIGAILALRGNREDFAFIIPYVRFREDASSGQPIVLDAEAIMDGRILALIGSGFIGSRLIVPNYVLEEIQTLANEGESSLRQRAQRGLDHLDKMQKSSDIQISIHEASASLGAQNIHSRLIDTAKFLGAKLLTLDESLTKIAKLQGIFVLNLNELDIALRPSIAVGERLHIALVRPGKEDHQAVGYLPDGTMVVVNLATDKIGTSVNAVVTSTLQTQTGILVFAELLK